MILYSFPRKTLIGAIGNRLSWVLIDWNGNKIVPADFDQNWYKMNIVIICRAIFIESIYDHIPNVADGIHPLIYNHISERPSRGEHDKLRRYRGPTSGLIVRRITRLGNSMKHTHQSFVVCVTIWIHLWIYFSFDLSKLHKRALYFYSARRKPHSNLQRKSTVRGINRSNFGGWRPMCAIRDNITSYNTTLALQERF